MCGLERSQLLVLFEIRSCMSARLKRGSHEISRGSAQAMGIGWNVPNLLSAARRNKSLAAPHWAESTRDFTWRRRGGDVSKNSAEKGFPAGALQASTEGADLHSCLSSRQCTASSDNERAALKAVTRS